MIHRVLAAAQARTKQQKCHSDRAFRDEAICHVRFADDAFQKKHYKRTKCCRAMLQKENAYGERHLRPPVIERERVFEREMESVYLE